MTDRTADIAIAGAGMAGLVSGATAARHGLDVAVFEKGSRPGGSMLLSGGTIWTYDEAEAAIDAAPRGNSRLQTLVVERYENGVEWLRDCGVDLTAPRKRVMNGADQTIVEADTEHLTETLADVIRSHGGTISTGTPLTRLRGDDRRVTGFVAESDAETYSVDAEAVVLATGGMQGNETLVEQYITDRTDRLWLRGNPWSTGDGYLAARAVGAKTTDGTGWFYGHNMAAPPATFSTAEFVDVTQYYGPSAIAVDETGRRFVDESACTGEEDLAVATARDADGLAYYLLDAELYESALDTSSLQVATIVDRADAAGGRVVSADSRSGLRSAVADWSLNGDQLLETLDTYNAAMRDGSSLTPPRTTDRRPFETPPFYVVGVQPGITFATGGLAVDEDMAVLSRARSSSTLEQSPQDSSPVRLASIEGLYAAGADVGNVHNGGYFGGLATALVTGRIAGTAAVDRVTGHDAPTS